jgi:formylglycine-generating enzyme required for sulfatase activity
LVLSGKTYLPVAPLWFYWGQTTSRAAIPTDRPFRLPVRVQGRSFRLAASCVTQAEFALFLDQNPQWKRESAVRLELADEGYLSDWAGTLPPASGAMVTRVSWYAARAYIQWVNRSGKAPEGTRFALPDEVDWEAAARQLPALFDFKTGFWEWTQTPFGVADPLVRGQNPEPPSLLAYAHTVKGGSAPWLRGGVPATSTSPVRGFRLAIESISPEARP